MEKKNVKKTAVKAAADKGSTENEFYAIPNEACCSAEFPDGCIFSDET